MGSNGLPWARLWADLLEDPHYLGLSDSAKLLLHHGLMWWMSEGTWGRIPASLLTRLLPGTSTRGVQRLAGELVESGFWSTDGDGTFVDERAHRQVTRDELERNRRNAAERQARKRAKDRQERDSDRDDPSTSRVTPGVDPGPVTRDSDRDVTRDSRRDPSTRVEIENLRTGEAPSSPHPSSPALPSKSKGEEEAVAWINGLNDALHQLGVAPLRARGKAVAGAQARLRGSWNRRHLDAVTDKAVAAAKRGGLTDPAGWVMWVLTEGTTPDAPEVPDPTPPKPVSGISAAVRGAGTAVVQTDEASKREMELLALFSDETGESA